MNPKTWRFYISPPMTDFLSYRDIDGDIEVKWIELKEDRWGSVYKVIADMVYDYMAQHGRNPKRVSMSPPVYGILAAEVSNMCDAPSLPTALSVGGCSLDIHLSNSELSVSGDADFDFQMAWRKLLYTKGGSK